MPRLDPIWNSDAIQFPRLLTEICGNWEPNKDENLALRMSMDLGQPQVNSLFERAHKAFEENKKWISPAPNDKPGTAFVNALGDRIDELEAMLEFLHSAKWQFTEQDKNRLEAEYERLGTVASDIREIYEAEDENS